MSITNTTTRPFTQHGGKPSKPGEPSKGNSKNPVIEKQKEQLNKRNENLKKQQKMIKTKLERLSSYIIRVANLIIVADETPQDLIAIIKPTLTAMGLGNDIENSKTELLDETDNQGRRLFKVTIRRKNPITADDISKINRNLKEFHELIWNGDGIEVKVWGEYKVEPNRSATVWSGPKLHGILPEDKKKPQWDKNDKSIIELTPLQEFWGDVQEAPPIPVDKAKENIKELAKDPGKFNLLLKFIEENLIKP